MPTTPPTQSVSSATPSVCPSRPREPARFIPRLGNSAGHTAPDQRHSYPVYGCWAPPSRTAAKPFLISLELSNVAFDSLSNPPFLERNIRWRPSLNGVRQGGSSSPALGFLSYFGDFGTGFQGIRQKNLPRLAEATQKKVKCRVSARAAIQGFERTDIRPSTLDIGRKACPSLLSGNWAHHD